MSQQDAPAILVVDDEESVTRVTSRWLSAAGYECAWVSSGAEALEALGQREFALVVTDIVMPVMSGTELLKRVREISPRTAVIMLAAVDDRATATRAMELGAYAYMIKPLEQNEVLISVANALKRRELESMRDGFEEQLQAQVREQTAEVRNSQTEIVMRLIAAAEYRDDETGAHIRRIGLFAGAVAEKAGWNRLEINAIHLSGCMHDLGKVGVPDAILLKPGKLTAEEFDVVKQHTMIGEHILGDTNIPLLHLAAEIALNHHEKWDGSGYPRGLAAEAIPQSARIVALCDVYDALVTHRVYRPALPEEEALTIMAKGKGGHFDPGLYECFIAALPTLRQIQETVDYTFTGVPERNRTRPGILIDQEEG